MDNKILEPDSDNIAAETSSDSCATETAKAAFDYQPPAVEAPEAPTVSDMPSVENIPNASVSETAKEAAENATAVVPEVSSSVEEKPIIKEADPAVGTVQPTVQQPYQQPVQQPYQQPVQQPYQQPVQQPSTPGVTHQYYQYTPVNPVVINQQNTTDGFAVASLVCALAGVVSCCTAIPSLLAIIFAAISKAKNDGSRPTGMSTAGLILGIIGFILNLLVLFAMFYD